MGTLLSYNLSHSGSEPGSLEAASCSLLRISALARNVQVQKSPNKAWGSIICNASYFFSALLSSKLTTPNNIEHFLLFTHLESLTMNDKEEGMRRLLFNNAAAVDETLTITNLHLN